MRNLFLLVMFTLGTISAFADCSSWGISVWPKGTEINKNSIFIIQGFGTSQDVIIKLNSKYKIYLKSNTSIINLKVVKIYEGQYRLTQAILKPSKELIEGLTYSLHIDNYEKFENENYKWIVNNKRDVDLPTWSTKPKYQSKQKINFGCGPAKFVEFCTCINDESPVVVFTKITELKTGTTAEYFVQPDSTSLRLGHGMCSGAFEFEEGKNYSVSFSLMDSAGNRNDTLTKEITFSSPTDNDQENLKEKLLCDCPKVKQKKSLFTPIGIGFIFLIIILIIYFAVRKKPAFMS